MLIIGERINASRAAVKAALAGREPEVIRREARLQAEAGANYLDVNGGSNPAEERANMEWLCEVVQEAAELPLAIDSASPEVIEVGLKLQRRGRAIVNSISLEKGRYEKVLPLVKEFNAQIIALPIDDTGIPRTAADRLRVVERIVTEASRHEIALDDIFIDPLVMALSADHHAGRMVLEVLQGITRHWPGLKTTCGLSNISFGLPGRSLLNRSFLTILMAHGLSSALLDPLDRRLMAVVAAARALLGHDEFSMNYIHAFREGKLEE